MEALPPLRATRSEFAPTGVLRAGINLGNPVIAQKDPAGGDPRGVGPELARELARRLDVPIGYVLYESAGKMAEAVKGLAWDVAFLALDPARAADIDFSPPYVEIEGTYLVRRASPLKGIEDVDRDGVRVAAGDNTAYELFLRRHLKRAQLVRFATSEAAVAQFLHDGLDAAAGVRQALAAAALRFSDLRVLDGHFLVIRQAAGVPKGRTRAALFLAEFIEQAKASGRIARALEASGVRDVSVAPRAEDLPR